MRGHAHLFSRDGVLPLARRGARLSDEQAQMRQSMRASSTKDPCTVPSCSASKVVTHLAGLVAALAVFFGSVEGASADLVAPKRNLPRTPEIALRRAIPSVSKEMSEVQANIEEVGRYLRIPQRKPWDSMQDNVDKSKAILESPSLILKKVPVQDQPVVTELLNQMQKDLRGLSAAVDARDADVTSFRVADVLDKVGTVKTLQMPDLPFKIPSKYVNLPRLTGRATAEAQIQRPSKNGPLQTINGEEQSTIKLEIVLDGYSAPLTAGRFAQSIKRGVFNNVVLQKGQSAVFATGDGSKGGGTSTDVELPLEFKPVDDIEPRYKAPLDVQSGEEIPTIPLSVPGAIAMSRSQQAGLSDPYTFFFYLFDRQSAGLGGVSFDEGEFSVLGYVVTGEELLNNIKTGDVLTSLKLTSGSERLIETGATAAES
eukprot:gnl/TRDRNA2_/TRDRNA2_31694_c1_seq1.p1 gnl/TRDRNA2_/TRDRNA2_31694_c1~~gnl/TRDRNA2_/TRDRNA2_31694_c1_seq1.p1  ORF type:complete len:476 (+),score=59.12 gnl/TRDRNA2_/TRDRNA2_31694_c1_seq1:149-1429(+)